MDDHRATRGEQLRSRRRDLDFPFRRERELHPHQVRGSRLVIDVRLRERRLADGTPERRAFPAIEEHFGPQLEEDRLAERAIFVRIGVVRMVEVRGHADADRQLEQAIADRLDLLAALLDERLAVPAVERLARLLLDGPLDVDPVPVEAEREQDRTPEHALRAGDHVDHRVRHDGADVPRAARIRRRRVDDVSRLPGLRGEPIQVGLGPPGFQDVFLVGRLPRLLPEFRFTHRRVVESRGAHKRIVPGDSRGRFAHPTGGFKPGCDIPLLRGINDGDWLRCEGPGFRRPAVLLRLALRTLERSFDATRELRRPRGLGEGEDGSPEANGRLPSQSGARVRPEAGPDRAAHCLGAYLHLEVRSPWTSEASRRAHSMYRSASAGGMRDARIAGWAALATAATDATPTINARFGHGTVKTTMSAKYTM